MAILTVKKQIVYLVLDIEIIVMIIWMIQIISLEESQFIQIKVNEL